jgi:hypothetical protein
MISGEESMNLNSHAIKPFELQEDARHRRVALPPSKELNRDNPMHPSKLRPTANRRRRTRAVEPSPAWRSDSNQQPVSDAKPAVAANRDVERDKLKLFPELAK